MPIACLAGRRTFEQWNDSVTAMGKTLDTDDEALVDSLKPGHRSTPGYTDPAYPFYGRVV